MKGDDNPGNGSVLCLVCGKPVRDHRIAPCPQLHQEIIYTIGPTHYDTEERRKAE